MNKYFTTRAIARPHQIGNTRTVIYCNNSRESITNLRKQYQDAMPVTRECALSLVRYERSLYRNRFGGSTEYPHTAYIYPYDYNIGQAVDATDSTGCIVIQ